MKNALVGFAMATAASFAVVVWASVPAAGQRRGAEPAIQTNGGRAPAAEKRAPAGPPYRTADGKPDMSGTWNPRSASTNILEEHPGGFGILAAKSLILDPPDGKIPYQPWALAERDRRRRPENAYLDNEGRCISSGTPRIMNFGFTIFQEPKRIVFISGYVHHTRMFPLEGRLHLPSNITLWMGDPVGHWEGDTLVVDTTNFNGQPWMALGGDFFSEHAHLVERFSMVDADTLVYETTITDPTVFARPWTMAFPAYTRNDGEVELDEVEDSCHEGNADLVHLKNNYDAALAAGKTTQK